MGKKWSSVNIKYLLLDRKLDFEADRKEKSGLKKRNIKCKLCVKLMTLDKSGQHSYSIKMGNGDSE